MVLEFVAFVPWLAALDRSGSLRAALASALAMTLAFTLGVFAWFGFAIATYSGSPSWVGLAVLVVAAPLLQPQFLLFAALRHHARRRLPPAAAALASWLAYTGAEWLVPKLLADTLGHGMYAFEWIRQAADVAGAPGLTVMILAVNECVLASAERAASGAPRRRTLVPLVAAASVLVVVSAYGAWRSAVVRRAESEATPIRAALVQANIGNYERMRAELGTFDAVRAILDVHFSLSEAGVAQAARAPLDLLVWPETAYPTTFASPKSEAGKEFDAELLAFAGSLPASFVFGAYDAGEAGEFNAAFFADRGRVSGVYRKTRLFPLTERVPAWLDSPALRSALPWAGTWEPGSGPAVETIGTADGREVAVVPLICFDAIDPSLAIEGVRRGAEAILTLSNDSWFTGSGEGAHLHFVVSAFRSIETRRPQIRATNTGISAFIDATGRVAEVGDIAERTVVVGKVAPLSGLSTAMLVLGDWLGPCSFFGALLLVGAGWRRGEDKGRAGR